MSDEYLAGVQAACAAPANLQDVVAKLNAQRAAQAANVVEMEKEHLRTRAAHHQRFVNVANEALFLLDENPIIQKYLNLIQELRSYQP